MGAHPKLVSASATTDATSGATADATLTVPAGKKWLVDVVSVSVDAANNTVDLKMAGNTIWDQLSNITSERIVELTMRYPRSAQLEENETIVATVTTTEAVAKTVTLKAWVIEV